MIFFGGGTLALRLSAADSGFEHWLGTLCRVLGRDTLLSQCLSSPRCIKRVSMGLTVSHKTAKNLAVRRKIERIQPLAVK